MWRPQGGGKALPYELRKALDKRFDLAARPRVLTADDSVDLAYIHALADQEIPGASDLLAAIDKHHSIEIWLSY